MSYGIFSEFYDRFMSSADYEKRADYILSLFNKFDRMPTLMLDVGCGTGTFTKIFTDRSIDVIGADPSEDMLNIAREKCPDALFLCQAGNELDLYGTVDGAVSCMDSLNHITDYTELLETFRKVSLFLEKDRLFIFDLNSEYKHRELLGDNAYTFEDDDVFCAWQNYTDENLLTEEYLDFFKKSEGGKYARYTDYITEKCYNVKEIEKIARDSDFEVLAIYDDLSYNKPEITSDRLYFVLRKGK